MHLVPLLVGVGEDGGVAGGGHPGHLAGEGAAALQREDEHLAVDPVQARYVHLRHRQPYPEQPDMQWNDKLLSTFANDGFGWIRIISIDINHIIQSMRNPSKDVKKTISNLIVTYNPCR